MAREKMIEKEVGSYISTLLREYFGKGPSSVYVTVADPYIVIHLRGFLAPTEKILLKQNETRRILETRDILMNDLRAEITLELFKIGNFQVTEIYADWNLEEQTGLILGIFERPAGIALKDCPKEIKNQKFLKAVEEVFEKVQKVPDSFEIYSLNDRTVLIERSGIFIHIEIELIRAGFFEELKLVKRPLERKMLEQLELGQNIREVFLDWNFDEDKGYIILILQPEKS
ncbi:hypothetical protein AC739_00725 [Planococcus glaciei]|uniref:DUF2294 domain-containing protein n=1 Tax=Planococcus glaciei TaxID=459472 RepID=UPI00069E2700|nr:Na-translocating system protein MpsC family protein [Planococcus glaciei]KOF12070.1 hypothetical protein AC739_00725 [Planococcus glaciei]